MKDALIHENFDDIHDAADSAQIADGGGWDVRNDALFTNGHNDGTVAFEPVTIDHDTAELSFRIRTPDIHPFEHSDFLRVWLHVEGYGDILLDEFRRDGNEMLGSESGQSFAGGWADLSYLNDGLPDGATQVTLKFESHISAGNEKILIDDVKLEASHDPDADYAAVVETVIHEDFDHLHRPEDSDAIDRHTDWEVEHGALFTNSRNDGLLQFETVTVDDDRATLSFTAKSADPCRFETHQDFLKVFLHVEGVGNVLLDEFRTNGHEFVGSITGQTFDDHGFTQLDYSRDLPEGATDVTLKFVSHTTTTSEWIKIDDVKLETESDVCDLCPEGALKLDFEGLAKGDGEQAINAALEHVTITALRNGRDDGKDEIVQAEHMHERGFHTVHAGRNDEVALGNAFEKLNGDYGKLWTHFDGHDGSYELKLRLQDENDGQSWVKVTIGHEVEWVRLDADTDGRGSDHGPFSEVSVGEFDIHRGEQVKVEIWRDGGEMGRIDALLFHNLAEPATGGDAMIFDTDHITGGDHDLAAGDGKVLIISEDNDSSDPDDNVSGGAVRFDFDVPVTLYTIDVIDTEEGGTIELFDAEGAKIGEVVIPGIGDNTTATVDLGGVSGVSSMIVTLNGSGALDNLCYDKDGVPMTAALGDRVFFDADRDGVQDAGEVGVEGVTVTLTGAGEDGVFGTGDDVTATQTTDADGGYLFEGLAAGDYKVTFSDLPEGTEFTRADQGDDATDSDADPANGMTDIITLAAGEENLTVDAGLVTALGALSGRYFCDENGNDVDDGEATDPGIAGVAVTLRDAAGNVVATTTTGAQGAYRFDDLAPGSYSVTFTDPDGVLAGKQLVAPDVEDRTTPAGTGDEIDSDAIGDTVTSVIDGITVVAGQETTDNDAGAEKTASLGDFVFFDDDFDGQQDAGEAGVAGVTVTLIGGGADGVIGTGDDTAETTVTDAGGFYGFTGLTPGEEYQVAFDAATLPAGTVFTTADIGDDASDSDADATTGETGIVTLAPGENNPTLDAGIVRLASLGNLVFEDLNANGIQDTGEAGIDGATVSLLDDSGTPIATTQTAGGGLYSFDDLLPGDYQVRFDQPAGFTEVSPVDQGGDDARDSDGDPVTLTTGVISLAPGENDDTNDQGYFNLAALGDRVFEDLDRDGVQDAGEAGIADAEVKLLDADGAVIATTQTDADGLYLFDGLTPGDYQVMFVRPDGFDGVSPADQGGDDAADSDGGTDLTTQVVTLQSGETDRTLDQGFFRIATASLGDFVWHDLDGDGLQDDGEPGIGGVTVNLLDAGGTVIDTTQTDADGRYLFDGLDPGDYRVQFLQPAGFTQVSPQDAGSDDAIDSDGLLSGVVTLAEGDENLTLDQGFYNLASLGDFVFEDLDADGIQDGGEAGIEGATVRLISNGAVISTTVTDDTGFYQFVDLLPGGYRVEFVTPDGFTEASPANVGGDDTVDSDGLLTAETVLASGEDDPTLDQGFYNLAALGDFVFLDANGNGIQDGGEAGVEGVTVKLLDGLGAPILDGGVAVTTTTDADGFYLFDGLIPGDYSVMFVAPDGFAFTVQDAGPDDAADSDADAGGMTGTVTLRSAEVNFTLDAGLVTTNTDPQAVDDMLKLCAPGGTMTGGMPTTGIKTVDVLANDIDDDGDLLSIAHVEGQAVANIGDFVTLASGATVTLVEENGTLLLQYDSTGASYDVDTDDDGTVDTTFDAEDLLLGLTAEDSFDYSISDGNGGTDVGTVAVEICGAKNLVETLDNSAPISVSYEITPVSTGGFPPLTARTEVQLEILDPSIDAAAFFGATPDAGLNGFFKFGYCVDRDRDLETGPGEALLYSTLGDLPDTAPDGHSIIDKEENLDLLNWVLNQGFEDSFTFADIQSAIWELVDAEGGIDTDQATPGVQLSAGAQDIVDQAFANGEGFVPGTGAGDILGLIFAPTDDLDGDGDNGQPYVVGVQLTPCLCDDMIV